MSTIPTGYKLQLVSPDDVVVEELGLGGFDLERHAPQQAVITYIREAMRLERTGQLELYDGEWKPLDGE